MQLLRKRAFTPQPARWAVAAALTVAVLLVAALLTRGPAFALSQGRTSDVTFHHGPFKVSLIGEDGEPMHRPFFDVTGGMPGMPARHASVRIANTGNQTAHYGIHVTGLQPQGARSLDDVLEATVRQQSSSDVIYRGRLSSLSLDSSVPLRAGEVAVYDIALAWPDTPADDNPYQNCALSFVVNVTATQA